MNLSAAAWQVLALVGILAVLAQVSFGAARAWLRKRRFQVRMRRAGEGEAQAANWLRDHGYQILGSQVAVDYPVRVERTTQTVTVRADYLVERRGIRYVVEVKTGRVAPSIATPATRRQLLEYRLAFDVDGVLLVDAEQGAILDVTFPLFLGTTSNIRRMSVWPLLVAFLLGMGGAIVGLVYFKHDFSERLPLLQNAMRLSGIPER